jgi:hypothetical protein
MFEVPFTGEVEISIVNIAKEETKHTQHSTMPKQTQIM